MSPCWDTEESSRFNAIGPLPLPILSHPSPYHEVPALLSALAPVSAVLVYAHPPPKPPTSDLVLFSCYRYPSLGLLFPAGSVYLMPVGLPEEDWDLCYICLCKALPGQWRCVQ